MDTAIKKVTWVRGGAGRYKQDMFMPNYGLFIVHS